MLLKSPARCGINVDYTTSKTMSSIYGGRILRKGCILSFSHLLFAPPSSTVLCPIFRSASLTVRITYLSNAFHRSLSPQPTPSCDASCELQLTVAFPILPSSRPGPTDTARKVMLCMHKFRIYHTAVGQDRSG